MLTKNDMSRVVVQALFNTEKLPEKELYKKAYNILIQK